jgi:tetratricopeptide (TPR) repeat protein
LIGREPPGPAFLSSHCDSVQATSLMELGRWRDAEALLLRAKADFEAAMSAPSWHPDIALADLRTRQGRYAEAEALLLGKEQLLQALLPASHLHLERGDHALARDTARRGLRLIGNDRLRAAELLTVHVDALLAMGDVDGAVAACEALTERTRDLGIATLRARADAARARVLAAQGEPDRARRRPRSRRRRPRHGATAVAASLLLELARLQERAGDHAAAALAAAAASSALAVLDVVAPPADVALLQRLVPPSPMHRPGTQVAELRRDDRWWSASLGGTSVRLRDSLGMRYLAELVAAPGIERHALDLIDGVEGVGTAGQPDRRALGHAGEVVDGRARTAYRHRIEALRSDIDDTMSDGRLEAAEALQGELDQLVAQLARAFGLGGRNRVAASAAERARLNVTRALRAALARLDEAVPGAGAALDRRVRTGLYCAYEPADDDPVRWIVQS